MRFWDTSPTYSYLKEVRIIPGLGSGWDGHKAQPLNHGNLGGILRGSKHYPVVMTNIAIEHDHL